VTRSECGFTVMWSCYCTDAAYDTADLAERCPHHDRPRVAEPVDLDDHGLTGGVITGHRCPSAALASARANARPETDQPDAACAAGTEEQQR
jgi:hypothetical protein